MAIKLFPAEALGAQVVLQFGDAVFHVGAPIVVPPDLLRTTVATGDKDAEDIAGHIDQLAADAVAALTHLLANHHESPLGTPAVQRNSQLAHGVVVVQHRPWLRALGGALYPWVSRATTM